MEEFLAERQFSNQIEASTAPAGSELIPGVDSQLLIKDAAKIMPDLMRRSFLRGAFSLGALTFLTGCDIVDSDAAEGVPVGPDLQDVADVPEIDPVPRVYLEPERVREPGGLLQ